MDERREWVPGTGLPLYALLILIGASVGLFVFWNGALWRVPRGTSHVGRFVVSYLAVIPIGALLLAALKRLTWARFVTSVAVVWAVKLVMSSLIYEAVALSKL